MTDEGKKYFVLREPARSWDVENPASPNVSRARQRRQKRDRELFSQQVMEEGSRGLSKAERAAVKKGEERARRGETARPMTEEQESAYRAFLAEAKDDELAMAHWAKRGFLSGDPHDRPSLEAADEVPGRNPALACEHGYGGRHTPAGQRRACEPLGPNNADYWLGHVGTRDPSPRPKRNNPRTHPQLDESKWGGEEDALEALMEEVPLAVGEGGGLTGVEADSYYRALHAMTALPAQAGGNPDKDGAE